MRWPAESLLASWEEQGQGQEEDCWKEAVERSKRDCQGMYRSMSCTTEEDLKSVERKERMMATYGLRSRVERHEGVFGEDMVEGGKGDLKCQRKDKLSLLL